MLKSFLFRFRTARFLGLLAFVSSLSVASPAWAAAPANRLVVHPVTPGMPLSSDFTVKIRAPGQEWQDVSTYHVKVTQGVDTRAPTQRANLSQNEQEASRNMPRLGTGPLDSSMASFDFSGSVEASITYNQGNIESARIRPLSYGMAPRIKNNTITFSLSQPRNLSVEVNGDIFHNLQLFANSIETTQPNSTDPDVIYYGPGVHQVGRVVVPSGKTVYLAGGALVEGSFLVSNVEDVRILGRGILYHPSGQALNPVKSQPPGPQSVPSPQDRRSSRRDALLIEYSKDVEVDGIIVVPTSYSVLVGQSHNVVLRNIKSLSAGGNNDGIDIFSSSDIVIDGVFMRNSDDNIAIYGHRWNYYGDTRRVTVQNSTLWADVAHPILVGTHGDSTNPDTLEDIRFLNIDILDQSEPQLDYQGCMSLNAGDSNLIRNVRFENIRVEDFREGQLLNLRVFFNKKYNTSPGKGIEDVLFRNVTYNGTHANPSIIEGYDASRSIKNIVFENLKINGRMISDYMPGKPGYYKTADMAHIFVGDHVEGVVFGAVVAAHASTKGDSRQVTRRRPSRACLPPLPLKHDDPLLEGEWRSRSKE
jgi:hypothetical protein